MNNIDNADKNLDTKTLRAIISYCKSEYQVALDNYHATGCKYFDDKCDAYNDVISYCIHQLINNYRRKLDNIVSDVSSN